MPASPSAAKNLLFSTDYPIDKVVYKHEFTGSVAKAANQGDSHTFTIAHGLPFTPHCIGTYSDDGFTTSYDFGSGDIWYDPTFHQYGPRILATVTSDATSIYVEVLNFDTTRTFDFHVVGLVPQDIPDDVYPAATNTGDFNLNTDYNYMKILASGQQSSSANNITWVIPHNLGYVPTALVFTKGYGDVVYLGGAENAMGANDYIFYAYLDSSNLYMQVVDNFNNQPMTAYYRIYLDE